MKHVSITEVANNYLKKLSNALEKIDMESLDSFAQALLEARQRDATIYFIGNGGSASTCSHFAIDLSFMSNRQVKNTKKRFKAISICDNQAVITAIGNDYGYENIFKRQLEVLLKKEDVLISISASGNSSNLIEATKFAKDRGVKTVAITSFDGGLLGNISDINVLVPTSLGEYGVAEDSHLVLNHILSSYFLNYLNSEEK